MIYRIRVTGAGGVSLTRRRSDTALAAALEAIDELGFGYTSAAADALFRADVKSGVSVKLGDTGRFVRITPSRSA